MQGMRGAGKKAVTVKKDYAGVKGAGEGAGTGTEEATSSPRKKAENQNEMAIRILKRAREMAKKKGKEYTGPGARIQLDDDEVDGEAPATARDEDPKSKYNAAEVYEDMLKRADEIRAHLRETQGAQRPKYDGSGFEVENEDLVDDALDEEDESGVRDAVEKVVGVAPGGETLAGEEDRTTVVG